MRRQAPEDLAGHPGYNNIGRVNPDGSVACSAIAAPAGYSMADADFFRQALATAAASSGSSWSCQMQAWRPAAARWYRSPWPPPAADDAAGDPRGGVLGGCSPGCR